MNKQAITTSSKYFIPMIIYRDTLNVDIDYNEHHVDEIIDIALSGLEDRNFINEYENNEIALFYGRIYGNLTTFSFNVSIHLYDVKENRLREIVAWISAGGNTISENIRTVEYDMAYNPHEYSRTKKILKFFKDNYNTYNIKNLNNEERIIYYIMFDNI